jgi:prepilin-type processing-associated H-X9-DG protein
MAATCAANLRQLGIGWSIYADQSDGTIAPGRPGRFNDDNQNVYWVGNGYQWRPRWFVRLGAECGFNAFLNPSPAQADDNAMRVDGSAVFLCPQVADSVNNRNYPFGYNFQFLGNTRFKGNGKANGFIHFPVKAERLRAADTVMAADALGTAAGKPAALRTPYRVNGSGDLFAVSNHGWSLDPPRLVPGGDFCDDNNRAPEHRSAPELRHNSKANVVFCDGHVAAMNYEQLGYVQNADGSVAYDGPGTHNSFFSGTGRDDDPPSID